jgi:hypothetical protein
LTALALATGALAVAGCGGSSKSTATTAASTPPATTTTATTPTATVTAAAVTFASGTPLSHTVWIARGDKICAHANTELSTGTLRSPQAFASALSRAAVYDKTEASELGKLVPPASEASDWKQIVNDIQLFGEYTSKVAEDTRAGNNEAAHPLLLQGEAIHARLAAIARRAGFTQCDQI